MITFTQTTITMDKETRTVKNPRLVAARLQQLSVDTLSPIQARRLFHAVCRFYQKGVSWILTTDQPVRHEFMLDGRIETRTGLYRKGMIVWEDKEYSSLSAFAVAHYKDKHPTRKTANGWIECKTLVESEWISLSELRTQFLKN